MKIIDSENFRNEIEEIAFLKSFTDFVVVGVPMIEIAIVALLCNRRLRIWGLLLSLISMLGFTSYVITIKSLDDFLPCSCGGLLERMTFNEHLLFNSLLILLVVLALLIERKAKQNNKLSTTKIAI